MGFSQTVSESQIRRKRKKRVKAFTLVEMLVVIAIIGILTAILVPVIGASLRRASEFAIITDMNNIELALEAFVDDGAVFYLNGHEIYRHNLADGPIEHGWKR